jgi:hypothetical protein
VAGSPRDQHGTDGPPNSAKRARTFHDALNCEPGAGGRHNTAIGNPAIRAFQHARVKQQRVGEGGGPPLQDGMRSRRDLSAVFGAEPHISHERVLFDGTNVPVNHSTATGIGVNDSVAGKPRIWVVPTNTKLLVYWEFLVYVEQSIYWPVLGIPRILVILRIRAIMF